ncbi:MAG: hypothetical protein KGJ74_11925 [Betaproteobacteria bacterium]|jgi:hypothetical protein|uniref:hypothetical protein n=1 Tax=Thiomonas delicata TaxID=364030 RepID=UPI0016493F5A|nr:hypothetical protein [Thiomonas delicata]MDE2130362.1 hypothetical protein [Betaproteobacteria bacterium]
MVSIEARRVMAVQVLRTGCEKYQGFEMIEFQEDRVLILAPDWRFQPPIKKERR